MGDRKRGKHKMLAGSGTKLPIDEYTPEKMLDNECLDRILEDGIEKCKISLILPKILANPLVIQMCLKNTPYAETFHVIQRFLKQRACVQKELKKKKIEKMQRKHIRLNKEDDTGENDLRINVEIIKLIDYFHQNCKMIDYLPNWIDEIDEYHDGLLKGMILLHEVAKKHLKYTAKRKLFDEKALHGLFHAKELLKKKVLESEKQLTSLKSRSRWKAGARSALINTYINNLNENNEKTEAAVNVEFLKLNRVIRNIKNQTVTKRRELEEELETVTMEYRKQALADAKEIKYAIDEKNKYQIQLQAILSKYDTTIYEKFHDHLYLLDVYEERKKVFDEWMVYYRAEEEVYNNIVVERLKQERAVLMAKVEVFKYNNAAMKIQRWLRAIWNEKINADKANAAMMKGKKKGKKGKK